MEGELREERKWVRQAGDPQLKASPLPRKLGATQGEVYRTQNPLYREGWLGEGGSRVVDPQQRGLPTALDGEWRKTGQN